MLRLSAFCSCASALIDVLYLIGPVCSVYFRGLVYLCLICSGSKIDKLDVTLRSIGHHTLNKVCVIQPAADLVSTAVRAGTHQPGTKRLMQKAIPVLITALK